MSQTPPKRKGIEIETEQVLDPGGPSSNGPRNTSPSSLGILTRGEGGSLLCSKMSPDKAVARRLRTLNKWNEISRLRRNPELEPAPSKRQGQARASAGNVDPEKDGQGTDRDAEGLGTIRTWKQ